MTHQIQICPLIRAHSLPRRTRTLVVPAAREVRGDGRYVANF
jgi:hypothetical protein